MESTQSSSSKTSSLRWKILRQALLPRLSTQLPDEQSEITIKRISRKSSCGFNLIPSRVIDRQFHEKLDARDLCMSYTLPVDGSPQLHVMQREENGAANLYDFEVCDRYKVDNTGLICHWPSEDVLAYFCLSHADMFRSKRIIELGSGYGLVGLAIAAATEASEVVITDGNPQVINYIQHSIDSNDGVFGGTSVNAMMLHWNQEEISMPGSFDYVIASDCTFFKEFHKGLVRIIKVLLKDAGSSEALFLSPRRGDSLDKFLQQVEEYGMQYSVSEDYDAKVQERHRCFMGGNDSWPGYEKDHCYPLMVRIKL